MEWEGSCLRESGPSIRMQVPLRVNVELSESFNIEVGVRQGCVMSPWLFNTFMDGCIGEMKVRVRDLGARLNVRGVEQPLVASLYADDTVLLAQTEGMLQKIVDEFDRVCKRRKLKVNAGKSKVMVFEKAKEQTINPFPAAGQMHLLPKKNFLPCYKRPDLRSFALRLVSQERIPIVYRGSGV